MWTPSPPRPRVANVPPRSKLGIAGTARRHARRRTIAAIRAPIDHDAYVTVTAAKDLDALDRAGARSGHRLRRYRNHLARSHAGGSVRRVAGGGAGRGLLHSLRPSQGRRPAARRRRGEIVQMREADVLARLKPLLEDDGVLKIGQNLKYDCADLPAARHPRLIPSTTRC